MLDRAKAPTFSQDFSFLLPQPEVINLSNGARLIWLKEIQQEVFKIELIFNSGKWNEPLNGLSNFIGALLDKGTTKHTSTEISGLIDFHGAQLEIQPGYDYTSVSLYGLRKSLDEVLPLFCELVSESIFPQEELILQKNIFAQNLKVNNKKTSFIASKLLRQTLYGKGHAYGRSVEEEDLSAISSSLLSDLFTKNFYLMEIFLVGNFDEDGSKLIIHELESIPKKINLINSANQINAGANVHINELNGVQASLRLGKRFINRTHPEYPICLLGNHILGGYFGSRLMKNIREEKGLTYGIYSSIQTLQKDCFFTIGADVTIDKVELALTEIKNEIEKLINSKIPVSELSAAKNHFLGSLQLEISNPFAAIEKIKTIYLNRLDFDYYKSLISVIKIVTDVEIRSVISRNFSVDHLNTVVVS